MINAKHFADDSSSGRAETKYTEANFNREFREEGSDETLAGLDVSDRPLIVQVRWFSSFDRHFTWEAEPRWGLA